MSGVVVKRIPYTNRLAKLIQKPGGKRIAEAIAEAEANVAGLAGEGLAELDRIIARVYRDTRGDLTPEALDGIYSDASEMVGVAGVFGFADLGQAAYSLCELIDATEGGARCDREALQVHADTLLLLRNSGELTPGQSAPILDGLKRVVARVQARTPPA